jgi:hypothetical protein
MQNNGLYDTMLENSQLRFNKYPQVKVIYLMASAGAKTVYGPAMAIKKIKPQYYV